MLRDINPSNNNLGPTNAGIKRQPTTFFAMYDNLLSFKRMAIFYKANFLVRHYFNIEKAMKLVY
jgi:hypothetical protein